MAKYSESEKIELKTSLAEIKDIVETISAFSNARGGAIFIGINPTGKVTGVTIGQNTIENLAANIKRDTDPVVFPNIEIENINSKTVIKIAVKESPVKPVFAKGKVFIRVGKSNQKATADEIRRLFKSHSLKKWDQQTNNIKLTEIASTKIKSFLRRIEDETDTKYEGSKKIDSVLKKFELLEGKKLTNAAILLFGKAPQKHFISSQVRCAKFKDNEAIDFEDFRDIDGTLIDQIPLVLEFIKKHINVGISISGKPERDEIWEIPQEALREAVINAICHRDYESSANVQIRIFDNRLEIWNPGILPPEITIKQLKQEHPSIPRNNLIAKTFFRARLIERWGTGTNRIIRLCKEAKISVPIFEEKVGSFVVTFKRVSVSKDIQDLKLTKTQKAIIEYLKVVEEASASEISLELNIDIRTVHRNMKKLVNIITWTGDSFRDPKGKYKINLN